MGARADALAAGEKFYETGKPCKYGHVAPRRTKSRSCLVCERITSLRFSKTEAGKASRKKHAASDVGKEKRLERYSRYRLSEKGKATHKRYRESEKGIAARARALAKRQQANKQDR